MTTVIQPDPAPVEMPASPWHAGERLLQEHVGVAARMAQIGPKVLRDYMPDQHRDFYAQLPLLLAGAVDPAGDPWAGALEGEPGFAWSPDPRVLRVAAMPDADDPLAAGLGPGKALGLLGIELQTRRRNRVNGLVSAWDGRRFEVTVGQSFGNCPQYIQTREWHFRARPACASPAARGNRRGWMPRRRVDPTVGHVLRGQLRGHARGRTSGGHIASRRAAGLRAGRRRRADDP